MKIRMLLIIMLSVTVGLLVITGCSETVSESITYKDVTPTEAKGLIEDNEANNSFVILDVRTPAEYATGHLPEAVNINVESGQFEDDIDTLSKDDTYLVYCRSGRRSVDASEIMIEQGFKNVYNMTSGINEWINNGFPVVQ